MGTRRWYLDIGKNFGNADNFVRVYLKHRYVIPGGVLTIQDTTNLVDVISFDDGSYELKQNIVNNFRIKFIKKRGDGFQVSTTREDRSNLVVIDFKGGDDNSVNRSERETLFWLWNSINHSFVTYQSHNTAVPRSNSMSIPWTLEAVLYKNNQPVLTAEDYQIPQIGPGVIGSPWSYSSDMQEEGEDLAPFKDADNGDVMFPNGFYFNFDTYETYLDTASVVISILGGGGEVEEETTEPQPDPEANSPNLILDPDGIPSDFSPLQREVCESFLEPDEFEAEARLRICPTCIPNPNFIAPEWYNLNINEVWLNEATCTYNIAVKTESGISWSDYTNSTDSEKEEINAPAIRSAVVKILSYRNKIITDEIVCSNPPTDPLGTCGPRVPQGILDDALIEQQIPSGQGDGTSMSLFGVNAEALQDVSITNPTALELFAKIRNYTTAYAIAGGAFNVNGEIKLLINIPATLIDALPDDVLSEKAEAIQDALASGENASQVTFKGSETKKMFKKKLPNAFKVFGEYQAFFFHTQRGRLKIDTDYDNSTQTIVPFYAIRYENKFEEFYDDLKKLIENNGFNLSNKDNRFKQAYEIRIVFKEPSDLRYSIKSVRARFIGCPFKRCSIGLSKFIEKYNSEETLMAYVSRHNTMLSRLERGMPPWLDFLIENTSPALQVIYGNPSNAVEAQGCLDNTSGTYSDILEDLILDLSMDFSSALEYSLNSLNCRTIANFDPVAYQQTLGQVGGQFSENAEILKVLGDYKKFGESLQGSGQDIVAQTKKVYKKILKDKRTSEKKFFHRLTGKPIKTYVYALRANPKETVGFLLSKINPCSWEALSLDIIRCMMKGMRPIDVLKKAAKKLMGNLSPLEFEDIFLGLPPEVKEEVEQEIRDIVGELPMPWDYARELDAQKKNKTDNQYEEERNPPENPADPAQVSPTELEELQEADNNKKAIRDEIKALEEQIQDLSYAERDLDELSTEETELRRRIDQLTKFIEAGSGPVPTYTLEVVDLESELDDLLEDIAAIRVDYDLLVQKRKELSTKQVSLTSANLAQVEALTNLANNPPDPNKYEQAMRQIIELLAAAYIDLIVDKLNIDELKRLVDGLPGSDIFAPIIAAAACPSKQMLDIWVDASFATLDIDPCKKPNWDIPMLPMIPELGFMKILKVMLEQFLKKIVERIIAAMVAFLMRTLQRTLDNMCDIFQGAGAFLMDAADGDEGSGESSLFQAIADAFCEPNQPGTSFSNSLAPDGYNSGVETFNDLVIQYGGRVPKETVFEWGIGLSEIATASMWKEIFVTGTSSTGLLDVAWEVTQQYPEIQQYIRTQEDLDTFFSSITDVIPTPIQESIQNALDQIVNDRDSLADVCKLFCGDLETGYSEGLGLPDFEVDGPRFEGGFDDILDGFYRGSERDIIKAMDFDGDPFGSDPYCEDIRDLYNSDTLTGKQPLLTEPQIFKELRSEIANSIFGDLEISYVKDLIGDQDSYFNNLLADKENAPLSKGNLFDPSHQFRVKSRFLWPNAADTIRQHKNKWKTARFPLRLTMRIADNLSDAIKVKDGIDEEPTGFLKTVMNKIKGFFKKSFMRFVELFNLDKPTPTNLFPNSVGRSYYESLSDIELLYTSKYNMTSLTEQVVTRKVWLSLGFISDDVIISTPFIKKPDVELKVITNAGDYKVISGYSSFTVYKHNNKKLIDLRDSKQKYSITVSDVTISRPDDRNILDDLGAIVTEPENGLDSGLFKLLVASYEQFTSKTKTRRKLNHIEIEYDTSRYSNLYTAYMQSWKYDHPENYEISDFINSNTIDDYSGPLLNAPPNRWALYRWIKRRADISGIGFLPIIQEFIKKLPNSSNFEHVNMEYDSPNNTDRIYQDIVKTLLSRILMAGGNPNSAVGFMPSKGMRYGYKPNSKIQFTDLLYVNPESNPEDPTSWYYDKDEEDKIIGKSATENNRILFLDPEMYGGSYKEPKIYIKPARHTGVLGLMQDFLPEDDGCEPEAESKLFLREIKKMVSDLELKITGDKRLTYDPDCAREPPYDLIADKTSHAYLHGIVTLTIRTYLLELFLRCTPLFLQMTPSVENFDNGLAYFLLDIMEKGIRDTPSRVSFKKYSKDTYWYLFLEQMVQTAEREVLLGNLHKNAELGTLFEDIVGTKQNYSQPDKDDRKVLRRISRVERDSQGNITQIKMMFGDTMPDGYENRIKTIINAIAFNAFGKDFKQYLKNKEARFHAGRILTMKQIRRYCKIYEIWKTEETAKAISVYLINREFKKYFHMFRQELKNETEISSITKYALNPESGLAFGPANNIGKERVEGQSAISNEAYGDVLDIGTMYAKEELFTDKEYVPDSEYYHRTGFLLRKYVVVTVKPDVDPLLYTFFGAYTGKKISVSTFQDLWKIFQQDAEGYFDDDVYISDFFGNAELTDGGTSYNGSIGIRFGVQLSLVSEHLKPETMPSLSSDDLKTVKNKKTGLIQVSAGGIPFVLPALDLLSYEQDVVDRPIQKYIEETVPTANAGELLKCYVDRMCELEEYRFIMEYLFPVKNVSSMLVSNMYYAYINSVGEHPAERTDGAGIADDAWKGRIMENTKNKLRQLFSTYYDAKEVSKEKGQKDKPEKNFKKASMPDINLNLDMKSIKWWQKKRFYDRPFNKFDQECMEGAVGSFNQNLPDEQVAFSNDTDSDGPISEQDAEQVETSTAGTYQPGTGRDEFGTDPENKVSDDEIPENYDPNGRTDNPFININTEDPEDSGAGNSGDGTLLDQGGFRDNTRNVLGGGVDEEFIVGEGDETI